LKRAEYYFNKAIDLGNYDAQSNLYVLLYNQNSKLDYNHVEVIDDQYFENLEDQQKSYRKLISNYESTKKYFYRAAYNGNYDSIADYEMLLYIIERVKSDYSKDQLQSQVHLIAKPQAQYQQQVQYQQQQDRYNQKYLKYKKNIYN
jgi:hypothetical protein